MGGSPVIANRVLDIFVSEITLNQASIVTLFCQVISGRMTEYMRRDFEF
jgi:hypothetical protein